MIVRMKGKELQKKTQILGINSTDANEHVTIVMQYGRKIEHCRKPTHPETEHINFMSHYFMNH